MLRSAVLLLQEVNPIQVNSEWIPPYLTPASHDGNTSNVSRLGFTSASINTFV